jgi:hypothetical protein
VACVADGAAEIVPLREVGDAVLGGVGVAVEATLPWVFRPSPALDLSRRPSLQLAHRFFKLPAIAGFRALG